MSTTAPTTTENTPRKTTTTPADLARKHDRPLTPLSLSVMAGIPPAIQEALIRIGVAHPEAITTKQAAKYLSEVKGIPTAKSTLEVHRFKSRGPKYRKIGSRVFYTWAYLEEWANGLEVRIFDPSKN